MNYECRRCGMCCRGWIIHIDEKTHKKLITTDFFKEFIKREIDPFTIDRDERTVALATDENGFCVFRNENGLCTIHSALGSGSKPLGCRQFPLMLRLTPEGAFVGVSWHCPSVQENSGRPISDYREEIQSWLDEYPYRIPDDTALLLDEGISIVWGAYRAIEGFLMSLLKCGTDLEDALWAGLITICAIAHALRQEGKTGISVTEMTERISRVSPHIPSRDEIFGQIAYLYVITAAGTLEANEKVTPRENMEAIVYGRTLKSKLLKGEIQMGEFKSYYGGHPLAWKRDFFRPYVEHLIFRKFLIGREPVLHNLAALYVAYNLCDFYLYLSAYQAGRQEPVKDDGFKAIGIVERDFTTHNKVLRPFFGAFADGLIMQLEVLQGRNGCSPAY